jgi:hypothetical protein
VTGWDTGEVTADNNDVVHVDLALSSEDCK